MSYFTWLEEVWQWHDVTRLQNRNSVTVLSIGKAYIITNAPPEHLARSTDCVSNNWTLYM